MNGRIWEIINYVSLLCCLTATVTIGYLYLFAQGAYLTANIINVSRDFILKRPKSDKIKDSAFLLITIILIVIKII